MKVKELIDSLSKMDPDLPACCLDDWGNLVDLGAARLKETVTFDNDAWLGYSETPFEVGSHVAREGETLVRIVYLDWKK